MKTGCRTGDSPAAPGPRRAVRPARVGADGGHGAFSGLSSHADCPLALLEESRCPDWLKRGLRRADSGGFQRPGSLHNSGRAGRCHCPDGTGPRIRTPIHRPVMAQMADALADQRIATFRYNYPYSEHMTTYSPDMIDPLDILLATTSSARRLQRLCLSISRYSSADVR